MSRVGAVLLCLVASGMLALACGSEPLPLNGVVSPASPTPGLEPTAIPSPSPAEEPSNPEVVDDGESIVIEREVPFSRRGRARGVRTSTTYSPQTGKTTENTTYVIDAGDAKLPWVDSAADPPSAEAPCDEIGSPGSWRGSPLPLGRTVRVGPTRVRLDRTGPDALSLVVENSGADRVEVPDYSFELMDGLHAQGGGGAREYRPGFAESFELAPGELRRIEIDPANLGEEPIDPEQAVLKIQSFDGWTSSDAAYLRLADAPDPPLVCSSFETRSDAQAAGTTWLNRPAPLGRPVQVDESTTVRVTHSERGGAVSLFETYRGLDLAHAFPSDGEGRLLDGFEFLAVQVEVASSYPLMRGDDPEDWLDSIAVLGRVADEYSLELDDMLATPGIANLAWLEAPTDAGELNRVGYTRLGIVTAIPAEAHDLLIVYRQQHDAGPVFLSLEEEPRPAPTPVPQGIGGETDGVGLFDEIDALGEEGTDSLLGSSDARQRHDFGDLTADCAQHLVFPSAESRRKVAEAAESLAAGPFAEAMPGLFGEVGDPDDFCIGLFPAVSVPRMVDEMLFDDQSGVAAACALYGEAGLRYFASEFMWIAEVGLALQGDDAPVSIDAFDDVHEMCDWMSNPPSGG